MRVGERGRMTPSRILMRDDREIIQIEIEFVLFPFDGLFILTIMSKQQRQHLLAMDLKHARKIMIDGEIIDDE